jgi:hypothetical protein
MKMKQVAPVILLICFIIPAYSAGADEESAGFPPQTIRMPGQAKPKTESYSHHGFYLGAGGTWGFQLFDNKVRELTGEQAKIDSTYGANARMGYRLLSWFSTEVEYEWLNGFDASFNGQDLLRIKGQNVTGNMKFHFIPVGPVQPNFLVGFGGMEYKVEDRIGAGRTQSQWAWATKLGGGLDIYMTKHFLFNAQGSVVLTTNDITDPTSSESVTGLYYVSAQAGFQYRW